MSMGKHIKNLSSRNDNAVEKASAVNKWREELTSEVDKMKNIFAKENVSKGSDFKSSFTSLLHAGKEVEHRHKEYLIKESKISTHHKKSSNSQPSKKYVTNNTTGDNSIGSSLHTNKSKEKKHISYDPHIDTSEGYNPEYPDLFPGWKSVEKDCDTNVRSSKSIKRENGTYEPSVKRKLEMDTETVCESKPKKLKYVSEYDQISEKKDKHKKHCVHGQSEKGRSLNHKKENSDKSLDNYLKEKSSDKSNSSKYTDRGSEKNKEKSSKKAKLKINTAEEFTSSEANFEDCLGLNDIVIKKKKSSKPVQHSTKTDKKTHSSEANFEDCLGLNDTVIKKKKSSKPVQNSTKTDKKTQDKITAGNSKHFASEFTSSEANFEDCLGLNDVMIKKKKSSKPDQNSTKTDNKTQFKVTTVNSKQPSSQSFHPASPKKRSSVQKEKLPSVSKPEKTTKIEDIMSTLPQIVPNYRPLPRIEPSKKKEALSNDDALLFMSSKREKTAVYSGRRNCYTEVPSLFEICTRFLVDNIDYVEYLGNKPSYDALKPMLEKCNPQQLLHIENYNPNLLEHTDELWKVHCKRECRLLKLEENETYRELYLRAQDERERKLKSITANISASMSKYNPARQVKLAYIDSFVKPPRDVARKQAKNRTATPVVNPPAREDKPVTLPVKVTLPSKETPKPVASAGNSASRASSAPNHVVKTKPKVAPLMAKTLKSMKQCFRR